MARREAREEELGRKGEKGDRLGDEKGHDRDWTGASKSKPFLRRGKNRTVREVKEGNASRRACTERTVLQPGD